MDILSESLFEFLQQTGVGIDQPVVICANSAEAVVGWALLEGPRYSNLKIFMLRCTK